MNFRIIVEENGEFLMMRGLKNAGNEKTDRLGF